jgi:hypothetical protein
MWPFLNSISLRGSMMTGAVLASMRLSNSSSYVSNGIGAPERKFKRSFLRLWS